MKKLIFLLVSVLFLSSCENNIETNSVAMQGRINNSFWKSVNITAEKDEFGNVILTGFTGIDQLEINLSSANMGTYALGTNNQSNAAFYTLLSDGKEYGTFVFPSSVNEISLLEDGSGYVDASSVVTFGGSGTGLKVDIIADAISGAITDIKVNAPGVGYKSGDVITITTGNNNATFTVLNVSKSNGEVVITESEAGTITGTFKFTAVNEETGETVVCRDGIFYKVPVL